MTARSDRPSLLRYLLYLVVAAAVIPYGAVTPPVTHAVALLSGMVGVVVALVAGENPDARWTTRTAVALAGGLVAYGLWQISPEWSGAYAAPIWSQAAALIGPMPATVSVAPGGGTAALVTLVLPFVVFITALSLSRTDEAGERILAFLTLLGLGFAVFGLIQRAVQPDMVLFSRRVEYIGYVTGTFVNRNTAATFLGVVLVLQLARLGAQASQIDWRSVAPRLFEPHGLLTAAERRFAWSAAGVIVVTLALLMTLSRAGVIATVGALALLLPILQIGYGKSRRSVQNRWRWVFGSIASWLVLGLLLSIFGGQTLMRIQLQGTDDLRFCVYESMVRAIADALPFGSGFGAFAEAFPAYRDPACSVEGVWERAHNVFLEGMLGFGWVFVAACGIGAAVLLAGYVRGIWKRRRYRWAGAAGLSVLLLVSLHGLLDFSLQIPGMAVYTAAILGAASGLSLGRPGLRSKTPEPSSEPVLTRRLDRGRPAPDQQRRRPRPMVARAEVRRSAPAPDEPKPGDDALPAPPDAGASDAPEAPAADQPPPTAPAVPIAETKAEPPEQPAAAAPETFGPPAPGAAETSDRDASATPAGSPSEPPSQPPSSPAEQPSSPSEPSSSVSEPVPVAAGPEAAETTAPPSGPGPSDEAKQAAAGATAAAAPVPGPDPKPAAAAGEAPASPPADTDPPADGPAEPASPADATLPGATPADATPSDTTPSGATPSGATPADTTPAGATPSGATSADTLGGDRPETATAPAPSTAPTEPALSSPPAPKEPESPPAPGTAETPTEPAAAAPALPAETAVSPPSEPPNEPASPSPPVTGGKSDEPPASAPAPAAEKAAAPAPRSSLFGRLLLTAGAVAVIAFSGQLVLENARFRSLDYLGTAVWKRAVVPDDVLARASERAADAASRTCRPSLVKSAVVVALANLDRQDPTVDYAKWEASVLAARKALLRRLTCVPSDGDSWARLALVESTIADDPVRTARLLAMSQRTAPAEPGAVSARFAAWSVGRSRHFRLAHDVFVADLRTVLIHYRLERIRGLIEPLPPAAAPYILEVARDLSYERARRLGRFDIALPRPKL